MSKRSTRFAPAVCLTCGFRSSSGEKEHTRSATRLGSDYLAFRLVSVPGGKVKCNGPWTVAPREFKKK